MEKDASRQFEIQTEVRPRNQELLRGVGEAIGPDEISKGESHRPKSQKDAEKASLSGAKIFKVQGRENNRKAGLELIEQQEACWVQILL